MSAPAIPSLQRAPLPRESLGGWLTTGFGTALDSALVRAMTFVIERALIPDPDDLGALRRSAAPMLDPDLQRSPERFFDFPRDSAPLAVKTRIQRKLAGGVMQRCKLTTAYEPFLAAVDDGPEPLTQGDPVLLEHWVHEREPARGTVVALHGFTMGRPLIDSIAMFASHWYERGLDVVLVTMPYHGARTPRTARFSGQRFASPHVARMSEAVREASYEIGVIVRWLRGRSDAPVGLLGLSLGGYLTALAASLSDDLDFAIPMVPPVCIGDLAWRFFRETEHARSGGAAALSHDELRAAYRVHSPLAHSLRLPKERVLIVAGRGDRVVPPEHPTALWRHWGEPAIHWFSGSHLAPFGRGRIVRAIASHLESLDIL